MHPYAIDEYHMKHVTVSSGINGEIKWVLIECGGKNVLIPREDLSPLCTALEGLLRYFEFLEREESDRNERQQEAFEG